MKLKDMFGKDHSKESHPVRVRGLKLKRYADLEGMRSRTPCGCVG